MLQKTSFFSFSSASSVYFEEASGDNRRVGTETQIPSVFDTMQVVCNAIQLSSSFVSASVSVSRVVYIFCTMSECVRMS